MLTAATAAATRPGDVCTDHVLPVAVLQCGDGEGHGPELVRPDRRERHPRRAAVPLDGAGHGAEGEHQSGRLDERGLRAVGVLEQQGAVGEAGRRVSAARNDRHLRVAVPGEAVARCPLHEPVPAGDREAGAARPAGRRGTGRTRHDLRALQGGPHAQRHARRLLPDDEKRLESRAGGRAYARLSPARPAPQQAVGSVAVVPSNEKSTGEHANVRLTRRVRARTGASTVLCGVWYFRISNTSV